MWFSVYQCLFCINWLMTIDCSIDCHMSTYTATGHLLQVSSSFAKSNSNNQRLPSVFWDQQTDEMDLFQRIISGRLHPMIQMFSLRTSQVLALLDGYQVKSKTVLIVCDNHYTSCITVWWIITDGGFGLEASEHHVKALKKFRDANFSIILRF